MRKILLTIQYNGKNFCGWQVQNSKRTVQGVLEEVLSKLLKEKITLYASGRTDSGVHAFAQTAHFETNSNFDISKLVKAINGNLSDDVSILSAKEVKNNFHARFDVKKKTYLYRTYASDVVLPLFDDGITKISNKVLENFDKMKLASTFFIGKHNFKAFCASGSSAKEFEKTIYEIKIKKSKNQIDFFITGSGFLYNMVRIIVGTLIAVGENKIKPQEIKKIIASKDRKNAGKTMPAKALYLFKVQY